MKQDEAKSAIVDAWLRLPTQERATEHQASVFALKKAQECSFRYKGDRYQIIMSWLSSHIGEP
jgi:hypothetical protein